MARIIFFVSSMHGGGAERVASLLCNYWVSEGHEILLVPTYSKRGSCLYPLDSRIRLTYLADQVGHVGSGILNWFSRASALRTLLRKTAPVVAISFLTNVNVAVLLAARGLNTKVIVSERTFPPAFPLGFALETLRRLTYPWAHKVVVQTHDAYQWLSKCCPKAKGAVIPNPVVIPLPFSRPTVHPETVVSGERRIIMATGRLEPEKGYDQLLNAFNRLAKAHTFWDLVILGEGSERTALEQQCRRLGLIERVFMPGRIGNLADWFRCTDVFVLSSQFEGFPNALLEAMAHGLPAVGFDCTAGPRDIIRHNIDGLLVPPEAGEEGLSVALERIIIDANLRERMAEAALEVKDRFSIQTITHNWYEVMGLNHV